MIGRCSLLTSSLMRIAALTASVVGVAAWADTIVLRLLADPFATGAGKSDTDHLPNITGVYSPGFGDPEQARRIDLIKRVVPGAKQLGIVFPPEVAVNPDAASRAGATIPADIVKQADTVVGPPQ